MKQTKQPAPGKVVPFTGEFYPVNENDTPAPTTDNTATYLVIVASALIAGLSMGAIFTYQSADQVQLRQMKAQSEQLEQLKNQVCK